MEKFLVSWDIYGLESIVNISKGERDAICSALKGEPIEWKNPIQTLILRARYNMQRHYEIYYFESEIDEQEIVSLFKSEPQLMADTIRRIGHKIYSDRKEKKAVIE